MHKSITNFDLHNSLCTSTCVNLICTGSWNRRGEMRQFELKLFNVQVQQWFGQIQFSWQFTIRYCTTNRNRHQIAMFQFNSTYWNHSKAFRTMAFNHKNVIAVKLCFVHQLNSNCYKSMVEFYVDLMESVHGTEP